MKGNYENEQKHPQKNDTGASTQSEESTLETMPTKSNHLLEVNELSVAFESDSSTVNALRDISFSVNRGEIFGIVGESGSGKTVTARSVLGLLDDAAKITNGSIWYNGRDITDLSSREYRKLRGNEISMVFQDPLSSLNSVLTIGSQVEEAVLGSDAWQNLPLGRLLARLVSRNNDTETEVVEILEQVGIPNPEGRLDNYPHEFSGGMRQRVMIAIAIAAEPDLLIVDEPTTALDVTTQANILKLLDRLRTETEMTILIISHNLGVVAQLADRMAVLYAGEVMEVGPTKRVFKQTHHPYTNELLKSLPQTVENEEELYSIAGTVPSLKNVPDGCIFKDRCPKATEECHTDPPLRATGEHKHACHHPITADERYFNKS